MEATDRQHLIALHLESMYRLDGNGRIVGFRDGWERPAPRFALARSVAGNAWLLGSAVPGRTADRLAAVAEREPRVESRRPLADREYRRILAAEAKIERVWSGPAYVLPERLPGSGTAIELGPAHFDALMEHFPVTVENFPDRSPVVGIIEGGVVVSRCCSAREPSAGVEAGVDTVEGCRGRGYAVRVTAGWARALRALGRVPLYSTSWDNEPSQRVAERLGAIRYAVDYSIT